MQQFAGHVDFRTSGEVEILDLTSRIRDLITSSGIQVGQALVFAQSSTSAITTLEHEPGLLRDLPAALERLVPKDVEYGHQERWQDGNGHSHVRSSLLKPSIVVPIVDGDLAVGQWQQVVFVELDNKPRQRRVLVHAWGT